MLWPSLAPLQERLGRLLLAPKPTPILQLLLPLLLLLFLLSPQPSCCGVLFLQVLKVHLWDNTEVFGRAPLELSGDRVNKDLLLDSSLQYLYVTTEKKVTIFSTSYNTYVLNF